MKLHGIRLVGKVEKPKMGRRAFIYHPKDTYGVMIKLGEYREKHRIAAMNK
jgi:hypothetical protein